MPQMLGGLDASHPSTGPYRRQYKQLWDKASRWRTLWKDLVDFIAPDRGKYLSGESEHVNDGAKRHENIINGTAKDALRILAAGMQGGLTSPSRPWFKLNLANRSLKEIPSVRLWLDQVAEVMRSILSGSNFYDNMHGCYADLGAFGTSVILIEEDFETVVRFRLLTIGEYLLGFDAQGRPDTLYRKFGMTARQMEEKFGKDNLSPSVKTALATGQGETLFAVIHAIRPNSNAKIDGASVEDMAYESVYYEYDGGTDVFLRRGGYRDRPFIAPRWDFVGDDVYGGGPGIDALGDIKMLQSMEAKKIIKIDKHVDPPMNAPMTMKNETASIVSGEITYVDPVAGGEAFVPTHVIDGDIRAISAEIQGVENRIRQYFYNPLFLNFISTTKRMTAAEVEGRTDEKLLILGPVLERVIYEGLDPALHRLYSIISDFGLIPEPPPEIAGVSLELQYISTLAQAQKIIGTASIEQLMLFIGQAAGLEPSVLDKFDFDQSVDLYSDMVGSPADLVRSDQAVAEMRAARAAAERQQQMNAMLAPAAGAAKDLSAADLDSNNLLTSLTEGVL